MKELLDELIRQSWVDTTPVFTGTVCRLYRDSTTTNTDCFIAFDSPGREYIQQFIGQRVEVIIRKPCQVKEEK